MVPRRSRAAVLKPMETARTLASGLREFIQTSTATHLPWLGKNALPSPIARPTCTFVRLLEDIRFQNLRCKMLARCSQSDESGQRCISGLEGSVGCICKPLFVCGIWSPTATSDFQRMHELLRGQNLRRVARENPESPTLRLEPLSSRV